MGYLFLLVAIFGELVGTNLLKAANGFTVLWPTLGSLAAYAACFYFLSLSLKTINLSVAYTLWAGLGILVTTFIAVLVWKEPLSLVDVVGIVLILIGVVVLNLAGANH